MDPSSTSSVLSRRGLLRGAAACAVCLGTGGLGRWLSVEASAGPMTALDGPGSALAPAERLSLRTPPVPPGKLLFPVEAASDCYILDNYGASRGTRLHEGVDIMGSAGNAVFSVSPGRLTRRYTNTGTAGWGWTVYDDNTRTTYRYFHLMEDPVGLSLGDRVEAGDVLGFVGASGTSSPTNFHLHFEVRPNDVPVDPLPLLFVEPTGCRISPPLR
ncbi:MAG TPA: M23 family metallopeptidase [Ilumatobacteraceae bacterium]|nr:M23 family metallopeptidase [Ilumatobacteraceae bacterium]